MTIIENVDRLHEIAKTTLRNPGPLPTACYARGQIDAYENMALILGIIAERLSTICDSIESEPKDLPLALVHDLLTELRREKA